jgi:hypothetical protein
MVYDGCWSVDSSYMLTHHALAQNMVRHTRFRTSKNIYTYK